MSGYRSHVGRIGIVSSIAALSLLNWTACQAQAFCAPPAQQVSNESVPPAETLRCGGKKSNLSHELAGLVERALEGGSQDRLAAVQELRQVGPTAVAYLMIQPELRKSPRWTEVLDAVAQQKDAQFSGLYWHTNLDQALEVARREKKPVLSLRLLGNLTDELSCANSRYFRTTLYPNPAVRELLATQFVLHWQSVRAVPIITIDFGDGRQIKRTITGNSLHLVLDSQGRAIDVLPGLSSGASFVRNLQHSGPAAVQLSLADGATFLAQRAEFHQSRLQELKQRWNDDCLKAKVTQITGLGVDPGSENWGRLARLYVPESWPSPEIQKMIAANMPKDPKAAEAAGRLAFTKSVAETPLMRQVRNVSATIAEDTVRNEYQMHFQIHNWLANIHLVVERDALVAQVYSDLFLSPVNDPWYGLSKPDVYSAIKMDGRIDVVTQNASR